MSSHKKVVLTGGPSAGKTTIANAIERSFIGKTVKIPEAATILWQGGFFRSGHPKGITWQQKAIYQIQSSHEEIFALECPEKVFVCDRGTLDGFAYWPENNGDNCEIYNMERGIMMYNYGLACFFLFDFNLPTFVSLL